MTTTKNTSLIWRLSKLPTVEELRELVKDKIITQEEAKEVLFDEESFIPEGDRGERSLQSEIKFLRELVEKLSKSKSEITTIIREVEVPKYQQQSWYQPYYTWCDTTGADTIPFTVGNDSPVYTNTPVPFSSIKTF